MFRVESKARFVFGDCRELPKPAKILRSLYTGLKFDGLAAEI